MSGISPKSTTESSTSLARKILWSSAITAIGGLIILLIAVLVLYHLYPFWKQNLCYSFRDSWEFIEGYSRMRGLVFLLLSLWFISLYRGRKGLREACIQVLLGASITTIGSLTIFLFYALLISPKTIDGENKLAITKFERQNKIHNEQAASNQIELTVKQEIIDNYLRSTEVDALGDRGKIDFEYGYKNPEDYKISARCFELCFYIESNNPSINGYPNEQESRNWPIFAMARLQSELIESKDEKAKNGAYNEWSSYCETLTNILWEAVCETNQGIWFGNSNSLESSIENLKNTEGIAPELSNDVNTEIGFIRNLQQKANYAPQRSQSQR